MLGAFAGAVVGSRELLEQIFYLQLIEVVRSRALEAVVGGRDLYRP